MDFHISMELLLDILLHCFRARPLETSSPPRRLTLSGQGTSRSFDRGGAARLLARPGQYSPANIMATRAAPAPRST